MSDAESDMEQSIVECNETRETATHDGIKQNEFRRPRASLPGRSVSLLANTPRPRCTTHHIAHDPRCRDGVPTAPAESLGGDVRLATKLLHQPGKLVGVVLGRASL